MYNNFINTDLFISVNMEVFYMARGLLTNTSKNPALGLNMFTDDELFVMYQKYGGKY